MKTKSMFMIALLLTVYLIPSSGQQETHTLNFRISVSEQIQSSFKSKGRLFIFVSTNPDVEPRSLNWPGKINDEFYVFARSLPHWNSDEILVVDNPDDWDSWAKYQDCTFNEIPGGTYYIQLLWDQDIEGFGVSNPGNLFSLKQELELSASRTVSLELSEIIQPFKLLEHDYVKLITHQSDTLSKFWGKPIYERAAILLPSGYFENPGKEYPIRYNVIGGSGSLGWVNRLINNTNYFGKDFLDWWFSGEAPKIITVYLDGELNGNPYHVDSDYKGPFGYSLIHEFIPYIEQLYRGTDSPKTRFVDGCSTGGWASLALQIFYPETFNGVFSYSPDPVDFTKYLSVDIYSDRNMFYNKHGYQNPLRRTQSNSTRISIKDWIAFENILGYSGTYINPNLELGWKNSLFSPKGADGKPLPLFDPFTGIIDTTANRRVINNWHKYDLAAYIQENWESLGPLLSDKIYIWSGGQDPFNLNTAVYSLERVMRNRLDNPISDAIFEYDCKSGHCGAFRERRVIEQIAEKLNTIEKQ
jgi:hypothetical protein